MSRAMRGLPPLSATPEGGTDRQAGKAGAGAPESPPEEVGPERPGPHPDETRRDGFPRGYGERDGRLTGPPGRDVAAGGDSPSEPDTSRGDTSAPGPVGVEAPAFRETDRRALELLAGGVSAGRVALRLGLSRAEGDRLLGELAVDFGCADAHDLARAARRMGVGREPS